MGFLRGLTHTRTKIVVVGDVFFNYFFSGPPPEPAMASGARRCVRPLREMMMITTLIFYFICFVVR